MKRRVYTVLHLSSTCYASCFWSTALSSSPVILFFFFFSFSSLLYSFASLSGFHLACASISLGETSLHFHPVPFHAAVCCQAEGSYIVQVPGANEPGAVLIWYTVNSLLRQALPTQAASVFRLCLLLLFFCSSFLLLSPASR